MECFFFFNYSFFCGKFYKKISFPKFLVELCPCGSDRVKSHCLQSLLWKGLQFIPSVTWATEGMRGLGDPKRPGKRQKLGMVLPSRPEPNMAHRTL